MLLRYSVWLAPARAHRAARGAHLEFVARLARVGLGVVAVHVQFLKRDVHAFGIHRLALRASVQVLQHRFGALDRRGQPDDLESVAPPPHFDAQPRLDLMQMLIERTAQLDQPHVVGRIEHQIPRHGNGTHAWLSATRRPRSELGIASVMMTSTN